MPSFDPIRPLADITRCSWAAVFSARLQFTSLNGLAFADVDHAQMSRASTMSTMGQQLSQSIGIGMAGCCCICR